MMLHNRISLTKLGSSRTMLSDVELDEICRRGRETEEVEQKEEVVYEQVEEGEENEVTENQ